MSTKNRFACLESNEIECFRCGEVGHITRQCFKNFSIKCFKCRRLGHIARECKFSYQKFQKIRIKYRRQVDVRHTLPKPITIAEKAIWRVKSKSLLVQAALKAQTKKTTWILDSGCTSHMIGDKTKLSNLNNFNGGTVKFGNNDDAQIVGKGCVSLNGGKILCNSMSMV